MQWQSSESIHTRALRRPVEGALIRDLYLSRRERAVLPPEDINNIRRRRRRRRREVGLGIRNYTLPTDPEADLPDSVPEESDTCVCLPHPRESHVTRSDTRTTNTHRTNQPYTSSRSCIQGHAMESGFNIPSLNVDERIPQNFLPKRICFRQQRALRNNALRATKSLRKFCRGGSIV